MTYGVPNRPVISVRRTRPGGCQHGEIQIRGPQGPFLPSGSQICISLCRHPPGRVLLILLVELALRIRCISTAEEYWRWSCLCPRWYTSAKLTRSFLVSPAGAIWRRGQVSSSRYGPAAIAFTMQLMYIIASYCATSARRTVSGTTLCSGAARSQYIGCMPRRS